MNERIKAKAHAASKAFGHWTPFEASLLIHACFKHLEPDLSQAAKQKATADLIGLGLIDHDSSPTEKGIDFVSNWMLASKIQLDSSPALSLQDQFVKLTASDKDDFEGIRSITDGATIVLIYDGDPDRAVMSDFRSCLLPLGKQHLLWKREAVASWLDHSDVLGESVILCHRSHLESFKESLAKAGWDTKQKLLFLDAKAIMTMAQTVADTKSKVVAKNSGLTFESLMEKPPVLVAHEQPLSVEQCREMVKTLGYEAWVAYDNLRGRIGPGVLVMVPYDKLGKSQSRSDLVLDYNQYLEMKAKVEADKIVPDILKFLRESDASVIVITYGDEDREQATQETSLEDICNELGRQRIVDWRSFLMNKDKVLLPEVVVVPEKNAGTIHELLDGRVINYKTVEFRRLLSAMEKPRPVAAHANLLQNLDCNSALVVKYSKDNPPNDGLIQSIVNLSRREGHFIATRKEQILRSSVQGKVVFCLYSEYETLSDILRKQGIHFCTTTLDKMVARLVQEKQHEEDLEKIAQMNVDHYKQQCQSATEKPPHIKLACEGKTTVVYCDTSTMPAVEEAHQLAQYLGKRKFCRMGLEEFEHPMPHVLSIVCNQPRSTKRLFSSIDPKKCVSKLPLLDAYIVSYDAVMAEMQEQDQLEDFEDLYNHKFKDQMQAMFDEDRQAFIKRALLDAYLSKAGEIEY